MYDVSRGKWHDLGQSQEDLEVKENSNGDGCRSKYGEDGHYRIRERENGELYGTSKDEKGETSKREKELKIERRRKET